MVHCNNCSSELDAWVKIFGEFAQLSGHPIAKPALYDMLYYHALTGDPDCGNTVVYNFLSGEPVAGAENGRPMVFPHSRRKIQSCKSVPCGNILYYGSTEARNGYTF